MLGRKQPGKPKDHCWRYAKINNFKQRSWSCRFCSLHFRGGIEKLQAHLARIPKKGIEVCEAVVPNNVVQECKSRLENPRTKRQGKIQHTCRTPTPNPNPGNFQDESNGEAPPVLQLHHERGDGTTQTAESGFEAEPVEQPDDGNGDGTTQVAGLAVTSRADEMSSSYRSCTYRESQGINFESINFDGFMGYDASVASTSQAIEMSSSPNPNSDTSPHEYINKLIRSERLWNDDESGDDNFSNGTIGSSDLQASGDGSTNAPQVVASQIPTEVNSNGTEGSSDLQASGDGSTVALQVGASQVLAGHINALNISLEERYLDGVHANLVKGFLASHPTMCLPDTKYPRYVGTAYTCLAELLMFLDTHKPSDMSEASVHKFTHLMGEMRFYKFDSCWLNSLEERVTSQWENVKAHRQTLDDCHRQEKEERIKNQNLEDMIKNIQRQLEDLCEQRSQSNAKLASIQERKKNAHEEINQLEMPFGFRD